MVPPMISERAEYLKILRGAPVVLRALVRDLDDGTLRRRPAPDEWAIVEVVAHLADTEERALARIRRMLDEDRPALPGYDQEQLARDRRYVEMAMNPELDRFAALRRETVELLEGLDTAGWGRVGIHSEQGPMTVETYVSHVVGEDVDHLAQISRMIPA
jgi:hypothetical protein